MIEKLLAYFHEHKGENFDIKIGASRQIRVFSLPCFNDGILLAIPVEFNPVQHADEFYCPLISLFYAIGFFAFHALRNGCLFRGAIAYGEISQLENEKYLVENEYFLEAAKYEKAAVHPRIIFTPSAFGEIEKFAVNNRYCWRPMTAYNKFCLIKDEEDGKNYFDWLTFYKSIPQGGSNLENINEEVKEVIRKLESEVRVITDHRAKQKLLWMINYLNRHLAKKEVYGIVS